MTRIDKEVATLIEDAVRFAQESPRPDPSVAVEDLFA
jgi:TPP-dependent pyruvate/acetoin dehydrogenase alpha subunit